MKINNKRELQNIALNHFADIDYKDFVKIYRECIKEPYSFLTIDATLPASNPLRFRKICFFLIKITVTDQIKLLDRKIRQNEEQYDLHRKAAKISALSSENLDKYEYLTGEDLNYKPSTVEQAKFDYSPLSKYFNKGLEEDKKRRTFKETKKYRKQKQKQLKAIEDQGEKQMDEIKKSNQLKDNKTKNIILLKDGLEELIESYANFF